MPAWAQTLLWVCWPTGALDRFAARLDEPFTIRLLGDRAYVLVSAPDAVKEVLLGFPDASNEELRPFLGDSSLFLLRGEPHARHRRLLQPALGREALEPQAGHIRERTLLAVSGWKRGDVVDVNALARGIALDVIARALFGEGAAEIRQLLLELTDLVAGPAMFFALLRRDLGPLSPGRRINRLLRAADERIRDRGRRGGLLDGLTDDELVDETKTLLAAGYDPVASAVAWALYWIHADAAVHERLEADVAACAERGPYLDMICRETLRILPIVPVADRVTERRTDFMGHTLEAGTRLAACAYLTHRRPDVYDEPLAFRPERFEGRQFSPFEYYPFGGGRRRCVGAQFALFQMKLVLATLLAAVRFATPFRGRVRVAPRGVTMAPSRRLRLTVEAVRA
jgi:unspecific monooxygenase